MSDGLRRLITLLGVFMLAFGAVFTYRQIIEGGFPSLKWPWQAKSSGQNGEFRPEKYTLPKESSIDLEEVRIIRQLDTEYTTLVNYALQSVVSIDTIGTETRNAIDRYGRFWTRNYHTRGRGSGVIISKEGHIITNAHVVSDKQEVAVTLHNGKTYQGTVIGMDKTYDIAVLSIHRDTPFKPLHLGNSNDVLVGQSVFAIGNPFGLGATVTKGIVSAKDRSLADDQPEIIQTDAAINPGSSGGPLINLKGEVVGITTATISKQGSGKLAEGVGFAVPSNDVRYTLEQILTKGRPVRGFLGVSLSTLDRNRRIVLNYNGSSGVEIKKVKEESPADQAGLMPGDIITKFGKTKIFSSEQMLKKIEASKVGEEVILEVWRVGEILKKKAIVADADDWINKMPQETRRKMTEEEILQKTGIYVRDLTVYEILRGPGSGVVVLDVEKGSTASQTRLKPGDLIKSVNGDPVENKKGFYELIIASTPVQESQLLVYRARARGVIILPKLEEPTE